MKTCRHCNETKSKTEFYPHPTTRDRLGTYCKICNRQLYKEWALKNPEKAKANSAKSSAKAYRKNKARNYRAYAFSIINKNDKCCNKCKQTKPVSEFQMDASSSDGLRRRCKTCNSADQAKWAKANIERSREIKLKYERTHR